MLDSSQTGQHPYAFGILLILLCPGIWAAERATVKAETAPVYSARSEQSDVIKSLKRGDAVAIEFTLAGENGQWCTVGDPEKKIRLGYMRCELLEREEKPKPAAAPASPPAASQPAPAAQATPGPEPSARPGAWLDRRPTREIGTREGDDYVRPVRYYTTMFEFTPAQHVEVESLARQIGVVGCKSQIESYHRKYADQLMGRAGPTSQTVQEFNRFAFPCMVKMDELLGRLPGLMTVEQQRSNAAIIESLKKDLATRRKIYATSYPGVYTGGR